MSHGRNHKSKKKELSSQSKSKLVSIYIALVAHAEEFERRIENCEKLVATDLASTCQVQSEIIREYLVDFQALDRSSLSQKSLLASLSLRVIAISSSSALKVFSEKFVISPNNASYVQITMHQLSATNTKLISDLRSLKEDILD